MPAILEAVPYRKGDGTAAGDQSQNAYLAGHGFACLRLDLRGSGDSGGAARTTSTRSGSRTTSSS